MKRQVRAVLVLALVASQALAQTTYTWTQTSGGALSWTTGANWSGGLVPDPVAGDTINFSIPNGSSAEPYLDLVADRTMKDLNLIIGGGFNTGNFHINSGYAITLAGTTPTISVYSRPNIALYLDNVVAGTSGLRKTGSGNLTLNNAANSFSGGITLAGGSLTAASNGALGDAGNSITVSANSILSLSGTYNRSVSIDAGVVLSSSSYSFDLTGAVTGLGGVNFGAGGFGHQTLTLSNTNNTFTGSVKLGAGDAPITFTVNSLADSANSIELVIGQKGNTTFVWGSGAIAPLVLDNRQVIISGSQTQKPVIENANADPANTVTINKDLSITSTVSRDLVLQGINTGNNKIAGSIPNGASASVISLTKAGAGRWVLSGTNTYSGTTTVSGGTLVIDGGAKSECLLDTNFLSITAGAKVQLNAGVRERVGSLKLGAGATLTGPTTYGSSASSAINKDDTYFAVAGTGVLYVNMDIPPAGTLFIFR